MSEQYENGRYPIAPGHRGAATSIEAADAIAPTVSRLQAITLAAIQAAGRAGLSTNEIATELECSRDSIQPRTSELKARKLIADSGQRRRNPNGKRAIVWVAAENVGGAA
jgi:spore coat protein CotH